MDTLVLAIVGPIIGLIISLKTTKAITDDMVLNINKLEEQALLQKKAVTDIVKKQMGYLSLNERMSFMESTVRTIDEKQAKKMITLLQPVAKTLKDVQETLGI